MLSSLVTAGDDIKASEYNNLRLDQPSSGFMVAFAAASAPIGWLLCNGASVSTTTYADLFAVIGYAFGGSGGSFNLPDLRDKLPIGRSGTKAVGSTGGALSITLAIANLPVHNHTVPDADINHNHTKGTSNGGSTGDEIGMLIVNGTSAGNYTTGTNAVPPTTGFHYHNNNVGSSGSGSSFSSEPPYQAQNYIIKY